MPLVSITYCSRDLDIFSIDEHFLLSSFFVCVCVDISRCWVNKCSNLWPTDDVIKKLLSLLFAKNESTQRETWIPFHSIRFQHCSHNPELNNMAIEIYWNWEWNKGFHLYIDETEMKLSSHIVIRLQLANYRN